jgi:hypothetical protein
MDPDAPWEGSQEAAARKAVELNKTPLRRFAATADASAKGRHFRHRDFPRRSRLTSALGGEAYSALTIGMAATARHAVVPEGSLGRDAFRPSASPASRAAMSALPSSVGSVSNHRNLYQTVIGVFDRTSGLEKPRDLTEWRSWARSGRPIPTQSIAIVRLYADW